ncbi:MAG TPA: uroporphyrinogen-III C-methyltransferase [Terriglobales bacterium]|nr:uroporphyrinogen-III C-methyltransferase [Terriglobales bacterium]
MRGTVYLVGAGPGNVELLTVKATRVLQQANVVLHDSLVSSEVLELISPVARVIDVGKRCGLKLLTQDEINGLLISFAETDRTVVRLKGGDPLVFGRAGEEIEALREAGVKYEVVPGVTAASGAAAAAGISLTDRRCASSLLITTGHRGVENLGGDWLRLARGDTTLVVYMPGKDYLKIAELLMEAGLETQTPCVVVSSASRSNEQVRFTNLGDLLRIATPPAPAVLIVGWVAGSVEEFRSMMTRPELQRELSLPRFEV